MNSSPAGEIVSVCGDPGGAAALLPVIRELVSRGYAVSNFAYRQGTKAVVDAGLSCTQIPDDASTEWIRRSVRGARSLLVSTSHNQLNWEKKFVAEAKQEGVPSLAVLDFWSAYTERFSRGSDDLEFLPDRIAVMDEHAQAEMIELGVPSDLIRVTGQPSFEETARQATDPSRRSLRDLRSEFGMADRDVMLVFASQPLEGVFGDAYGYTEKSVLSAIVNALEEIASATGRSLTLLIRPHPRENPSDFDSFTSKSVRILVSGAGSNQDVVAASDLVLGMNSAFLVDACLLGAPTVSVQPGLRRKDPLPTNRLGASVGLFTEADIRPNLEKLIVDEKCRAELRARAERFNSSFVRNAASKIADEVEKQWSD